MILFALDPGIRENDQTSDDAVKLYIIKACDAAIKSKGTYVVTLMNENNDFVIARNKMIVQVNNNILWYRLNKSGSSYFQKENIREYFSFLFL